MADKKIYILTIEYNGDDEQIEYIQEEIITPEELEGAHLDIDIDEESFFDQDAVEIMRKFYTGEIGES
tara:strand:+ start:8478 stop:8681 length:204 start_codon:yes stop_codon:yes gene_type:complete